MSEIALAKINSFAPAAEQGEVSPEESIFVLSSSQLQEIITRAVQPLLDRVDSLGATVDQQGEYIAGLERTEASQAEDIMNLARLVKDFRKKDPGKTEIARGEKIERYLKARPDHRATYETLKGHLSIDNDRLGKAIRILVASGKCAIIKTTGDKRKRSLILLPR